MTRVFTMDRRRGVKVEMLASERKCKWKREATKKLYSNMFIIHHRYDLDEQLLTTECIQTNVHFGNNQVQCLQQWRNGGDEIRCQKIKNSQSGISLGKKSRWDRRGDWRQRERWNFGERGWNWVYFTHLRTNHIWRGINCSNYFSNSCLWQIFHWLWNQATFLGIRWPATSCPFRCHRQCSSFTKTSKTNVKFSKSECEPQF